MKILFGTDIFYQNTVGSTNFIQSLAKGLVKKGHQVFIIAPSKSIQNTEGFEGEIKVYGIRSVVIPEVIYPSKFRIPITAGSNKIRKIIEEINPDIISIQDHFMIGAKITFEAKRLGIPIVGTNHFMPENFIHYLYPPPFAKKVIKDLAWKSFIRVYKHMDLITTPTKTAADLLKDLGLKNQIIPISNGVNLKRFHPKNNSQYLKKRYKIDPKSPIILYVGRLDKEKNIEVLVKAFQKVLPKVKAKLVITGKGTERTKLMNLAKRLGIKKDVIFTGFVPDEDLPALYCMADVFTIASIAELQSIATLEALASGLPVVAVEVVALPELVHHGKNGFLFKDGDIEALANNLTKILQDKKLKKQMSEHSLKIVSRHNIEKTISEYEKTYKGLVSAK